jgi:hypothetical protein
MKLVGLVLALLHAGCLMGVQAVAGPTVDERGGVGAVLRVRGVFGVGDRVMVTLVPTAEASGFQPRPQGAFGVGLGAMLRVQLDRVMLTVGARALVAVTPARSLLSAAGGWFGAIPMLRRWGGGRLAAPEHWYGLGFELAADYTFLAATRSLLLSPGLVFHYHRVGGG